MVHSLNADTDFFGIVAGVLQGDTFTLYLFILSQDNIIRTSTDQIKENGFTLKKSKNQTTSHRNYDWDYADDLALIATTPAQAKPQLHSLEQVCGGIGFYANEKKKQLKSCWADFFLD